MSMKPYVSNDPESPCNKKGCSADVIASCCSCPDWFVYEQKWKEPIKMEVEKKNDAVNHPNHYTQGGIECIEGIRASMPPEGFQDYCKGNVLKYIWRWRDKAGVEDLKKAQVYLNWMIESAEGAKS